MAGLEYRASIGAVSPEPAPDMVATDAYYAVAKTGDAVVQDTDGKIVAAAANAATIFGVCAGRELAITGQTNKRVKVRTSSGTRYQVTVSAGTPKVGSSYGLTADFKLNASAAGTAVKVVEIDKQGNVFVTINKANVGGA
jgi:hypothetical protein